MPNKTLSSCKINGYKNSKDRLTVGVVANASGCDKPKLVVISKFKKPRCFSPNFNPNTLVHYFNNKKAWMTVDIFSKWIEQFDNNFRIQNRKVLLIVDNAAGHGTSDELNSKLTNIKIQFLPPNTTSHLQPLDAGIIKNLKVFYKKALISHFILII